MPGAYWVGIGMLAFAFVAGVWAGFGIGCDHMARVYEAARRSHRDRADG